MKTTLKLLKTTTLALVIMGSAFAQDATTYLWRSDPNNHGWKIAFDGPPASVRPLRFIGPDTKWVTFHFNRVAQIDNLDQGDQFGSNKADFYAMVWIDGQVYKSKEFSSDDGDPNWTLRVPLSTNNATIRIRLMDDDGGFEKKDDHVDINPQGHMKDLVLQYDATTGNITGDMTSHSGQWIDARGKGDDDRGRISFSIN